MINNIINIVMAIILLLQLVVTTVELTMGSGNGSEKKKEAIKQAKDLICLLPIIPDWIKTNILNDTILSILIDAIVGVFNKTNFFVKSAS